MIYFYPDGSAEDVIGNVNNGVVYLALLGNAGYCKHFDALSLFGVPPAVCGDGVCRPERSELLLEATVKAESNTAFKPHITTNPARVQSD